MQTSEQSEHRVLAEKPPISETASSPEAVYAVYQERCQRFAAQRDHYTRVSQATGFRNVVLFFAAFVWSFLRLGKINLLVKRYNELWKINDEGLRRLRRDWSTLPLRQPKEGTPDHPYANDLDLLGHASLQHLLSTPTTGGGLATLQRWLLYPAAPAEIRERQRVAAELAPMIDFRDEFELSGRLMGDAQSVYEMFLGWAESAPWLSGRPALIWLSRILPLLTVSLLILELTQVTLYPFWLIPLLANILLTQQQDRKSYV